MASSRYRVYNWAEKISQQGYDSRILFQHKDEIQKSRSCKKLFFIIKIIWASRRAETLIFHKYFPPLFVQRILRNKNIIFEFDDRIYSEKWLLNRKSRFFSFLLLSRHIVVSTVFLRDEVLFYMPVLKNKIMVIPTLVDLKKITTARKNENTARKKSVVNIGWVGTSGGFRYLALLEETIYKLITEFPKKIEIFVISDKPFIPKKFTFKVKNIKWSLQDEYQYFFILDISIMPLDHSKRAKSKAGFKIIQSMACGIPVVASSVGFNKNIIEQGENGFLAESPDDFYKYLKQLVMDEKLRMKMGIRGYYSVKKFDYDCWKEVYINNLLKKE